MKTIVIKNLSSILDECAVTMVEQHVASMRSASYRGLYKDTVSRFNVDVKITNSEAANKITYTITDSEPQKEGE